MSTYELLAITVTIVIALGGTIAYVMNRLRASEKECLQDVKDVSDKLSKEVGDLHGRIDALKDSTMHRQDVEKAIARVETAVGDMVKRFDGMIAKVLAHVDQHHRQG